jgi:hypothetical protein
MTKCKNESGNGNESEIDTLDGEIVVVDLSVNTKEMREKYPGNTNCCYIPYYCEYCDMWFERACPGGRGSYRGNSIITTPSGYYLDKETGKIVETKTGKVTQDKKPIPICWSCVQLFLRKKESISLLI